MAARDAHMVSKPTTARNDTQALARVGEWGSPTLQHQQHGERGLLTSSAYVKQVLLHPFHVALVISVALLAILTKSLWLIPLALIGEIVLGSVVACSRTCRQLLDGEPDASDLLLPADHRAEMVAQMSEDHRDELERLEMQVGNIRENCGASGELLLEQPHDLTLLLRGYVDLAMAHQAHAAALAVSDRAALLEEMRSLDEAITEPVPPRLRQAVLRRRDVVAKRLACWDQNKQAIKEVEHQLATIVNLIGLLHEKSIVQTQTGDWVDEEIERITEDIERHELAFLEVIA